MTTPDPKPRPPRFCDYPVEMSADLVDAVRRALFAAAAPAVYAEFMRSARHAGYRKPAHTGLQPADMRTYEPDPLLTRIGGIPLP